MCVGNFIKGIDNLGRTVLDTNYTSPDNDNCDYFDYQDKKIPVEALDLTVLHLNVRGLASKLGDVSRLLTSCTNTGELDIACLSETWLSACSPNVDIPGYNLVRDDRKNRKGGGVSIYINNRLKFNVLEELTIEEAECCGVEILIGTQRIAVMSLYRPPNRLVPGFTKSLKKLLDVWRREKKKIIICTDHNLDSLKSEKHAHTQHFIEQLFDCQLLSMITRPTRITKIAL